MPSVQLSVRATLCCMSIAAQGAAPSASAGEILEKARQAASASTKNLHSLQGSGAFAIHRRNRVGGEDTIWTEGDFDLAFDRGRYYLDRSFRTGLLRGVRVRDVGEEFDRSLDRVVIISDGFLATVVTFDSKIAPPGCRIELFNTLETAVRHVGFPLASPAKPWLERMPIYVVMNVENAEAIAVTPLNGRFYRGTFVLGKDGRRLVEVDIEPAFGHNAAALRYFVRGRQEPILAHYFTWRQKNSAWFVKDAVLLDQAEQREITFDWAVPNKPIDQTLFSVDSLSIPSGTQTIEHRAEYRRAMTR